MVTACSKEKMQRSPRTSRKCMEALPLLCLSAMARQLTRVMKLSDGLLAICQDDPATTTDNIVHRPIRTPTCKTGVTTLQLCIA